MSVYKRPISEHGGGKYLRKIRPADGVGEAVNVDVYCVLRAFSVTCPALQHLVKKALCAGLRGKGSRVEDIKGILDAAWRALELAEQDEEVVLPISLYSKPIKSKVPYPPASPPTEPVKAAFIPEGET